MSNLQKTFNAPNSQELDQLVKFCQVLSTAPFYAKMGPGGVLAIYLTAKEMGLPLMACLNGGLYTYDGKVTLSAQLMNMLIINAGHKANVLQLSESICEIEFVRSDRFGSDSKFRYSFTIEQAHKADYMKKDNWKKHPKDMLFSRVLSGGARKFMPDVLMNAYVIGEMDDDQNTIEPLFESQEVSPPIEPPKSEPLKIEFIEDSSYFKEMLVKYNIFKGSDSYEYAMEICRRGNLTLLQVVQACYNNPSRFEQGFEKWLKENNIKSQEVMDAQRLDS